MTLVMEEYIVEKIYTDFDSSIFNMKLKGYQSFDILFIEIDCFLYEYDPKLGQYLDNKFGLDPDLIDKKIYEAIDIGYDFRPLLVDHIKSLIEFKLIKLVKE